ncbi:Crp/Fnr family transcriptional regulator [Leekyejoonella antrihumi]|uniref:Crp/Fnr family transcriptional regulator n=1 Tax=Leekyejoonella antrihumi TaxID=1660198 RepID=A0A563E062_9MICO|nr:Crp/Fnr family transcriptional regulator [Leekyejoonella antrihumi]TWP35896.1 Crp/Fnr family transcriptional regulator [Leekyejoonella antrihumi]
MATPLIRALRRIDLFSTLSDEATELIVGSGATISTPPGAAVITEGAPDSGLRVVLEGSRSVSAGGNGRGTVDGEYVGELSMIDGEPRSASLAAGPEGVTTFALPSMAFAPTLMGHPEIAEALLKTLCLRLRKVEAATVGH